VLPFISLVNSSACSKVADSSDSRAGADQSSNCVGSIPSAAKLTRTVRTSGATWEYFTHQLPDGSTVPDSLKRSFAKEIFTCTPGRLLSSFRKLFSNFVSQP